MEKKGVVIILIFICALLLVPINEFVFTNNPQINNISESDLLGSDIFNSSTSTMTEYFFENIGQVIDSGILYYGNIPGGHIGFKHGCIVLSSTRTGKIFTIAFEGSIGITPEGSDIVSHSNNFFLANYDGYLGVTGYSEIIYENVWNGIDIHFRIDSGTTQFEINLDSDSVLTDFQLKFDADLSEERDSNRFYIQKEGVMLVGELAVLKNQIMIPTKMVHLEEQIVGIQNDGFSYSQDEVMPVSSFEFIDSGIQQLSDRGFLHSTYIGEETSDSAHSIAIDNSGNSYISGWTWSPIFESSSVPQMQRDCVIQKINATGNGIIYSVVLGGSFDDCALSIAVDSFNCAYIAGYTLSTDFPVAESYDSVPNKGANCFVIKLDKEGDAIEYSSFIGGNGNDLATSIEVDTLGRVYVTGYTSSEDFPVIHAFDNTYNGGYFDCFVFKLAQDGREILYSTYIGGSDADYAYAITIDSSESVCITGETSSRNFPTWNAIDSSFNGGYVDAFVLKLYPDGQSIIFSTFVGGSKSDYGKDIATGESGDVYITGGTLSTDFPILSSYSENNGGLHDCFVVRISSNGDSLISSTYLGGKDEDIGRGITVDSWGNIYITGETASDDFPFTDLGHTNTGGYDCFVAKINVTGNYLYYAKRVGGTNNDYGSAIALDLAGSAYITGFTSSRDFLSLNAAFATFFGGNYDSFVFKLSDTSDSDLDGISDYEESILGTNRFSCDTDADGLSDWDEIRYYMTDPNNNDTDSDELSDKDEIAFHKSNPLNNDTDSDKLLDGTEILIWHTNVNNNDTDNDGLSDFDEVTLYYTNPLDGDTDHDQLGDFEELSIFFTSPVNNDSDYDLMTDDWEVTFSLDPLVNDALNDPDHDLLSNLQEFEYNTNPRNNDTDNDELRDDLEIFSYNSNPNSNDTDFDELSDKEEVFSYFTDPGNNDTDSDLMPDGWEIINSLNPLFNDSFADNDLDGLVNLIEFINNIDPNANDTDFDELTDFDEIITYGTNANLVDSDSDALNDTVEIFTYGTNPLEADTDNDALSDLDELTIHLTNPILNDTDSDLMPDGWEITYGLDPFVNDSALDLDFDGLSNLLEYQNNAKPNSTDSDFDTLSDFQEVYVFGTSPDLMDTDFDELTDFDEIITYGTNATLVDSDFDQMPDGWEVTNGLNASLNDSSGDLDFDNLTNLEEYQNNTNPNTNDTDLDGLSDFDEIITHGTNASLVDSDYDGIPDFWEITYDQNPIVSDGTLDPDQDDLSNLGEYIHSANPNIADTDSDGIGDYWEVSFGFDPLDSAVPPSEFLLFNIGIILITVMGVILGFTLILYRVKVKSFLLFLKERVNARNVVPVSAK